MLFSFLEQLCNLFIMSAVLGKNTVYLPLSYVIEKINAIPLLMSDKQVKYILQRQNSNLNEQEFKSCHSVYVSSQISSQDNYLPFFVELLGN